MIKLFTNKNLLTVANRTTSHPLLFHLHYFEGVQEDFLKLFQLVDCVKEADAVIYPLDYLYQSSKIPKVEFQQLYDLSKLNNKKLLVYTGGDYGKTFNDTSIISWRNAGFKSTNAFNTIMVPAFITDPLERKEVYFKVHAYTKQPKISFTGFSTDSTAEKIRYLLSFIKRNINIHLKYDESDVQNFYNAAFKRFQNLKKLEQSSLIDTAIIYRNQYRAGAKTESEKESSSIQFFQNLMSTPYTFCQRGAGNFSIRFYESLASGKIPVLIDTDVALPLENAIDWEQHICRVKPDQDPIETLLKFHSAFDEASFEKLQKSNRQLYEDYLTRHQFFNHTYEVLKKWIV